jgi:hypothetical protein
LFQLDHRTALFRIQEFYTMAVEETTYNSQVNLVKYIRNNADLFNQRDFDNLTMTVQSVLSAVASNKQWFVQIY